MRMRPGVAQMPGFFYRLDYGRRSIDQCGTHRDQIAQRNFTWPRDGLAVAVAFFWSRTPTTAIYSSPLQFGPGYAHNHGLVGVRPPSI